MSKIAIVYWSGTGNTQAMAEHVKAGIEAAGAEAALLECNDFSAAQLADFDAVAFGCPAMGDEELESDEFEPLFISCEPQLAGRTVALFGSYEWREGAWMDAWKERTEADGATVVDALIGYDYPDDATAESCRQLGAAIVAAVA